MAIVDKIKRQEMERKINHFTLEKISEPILKVLNELSVSELKEYPFYLDEKKLHKKDHFFINDSIFFRRVGFLVKDLHTAFIDMSSLISSQDAVYQNFTKGVLDIYRMESFLLGNNRTEKNYLDGVDLHLLSIFVTPKQREFLKILDSIKDEMKFGSSVKYIKEDLQYLLSSDISFEDTLEPKKYKELSFFLSSQGFSPNDFKNKNLVKNLEIVQSENNDISHELDSFP